MYWHEGTEISDEELPEFEKAMDSMANSIYDSERDMYYFYGEDTIQKMGKTAFYTMLNLKHAQDGNLHSLKWLIEYRKISPVDKHDNSLLMLSAENGHLDMVEWLLESDVEISAVNKSGETALELAQQNGHTEIADVITGTMSHKFGM